MRGVTTNVTIIKKYWINFCIHIGDQAQQGLQHIVRFMSINNQDPT